jgi:iron(III) transport system ATP-binding protein
MQSLPSPLMPVPAEPAATGRAPAVELRGIGKCHAPGVPVLQDIHLQVARGSLTTLLGPSGCGKSTLLRLVAGLEPPTSGEVWIDGQPATHQGPGERPVSLVFQNHALFPHLDVLGNVRFGLKMLGLPPALQRERALRALALVGLDGLQDRASADLSGGQQQRVALARALAIEPQVLLLDEPLSNLDARLRRQMREEIRSLQQRLSLTVLYVTHDQAEAMAVSDQVVVMLDGRVRQVGTPWDTYHRPPDADVAAFMGDALLLDAECLPGGAWRLGGQPVDASAVPMLPARPGRLRLMVRPEAWQLAPASGCGLAGKIVRRAYLGRCTEYLVEVAWGELWVLAWGASAPLQAGAPVSLSLKASGVGVLAFESGPDLPEGHGAHADGGMRRA